MELKDHTTPDKLVRYSFLWSEVRLVVAAASLIFGATPVVYRILGYSLGLVGPLLMLAWIISGLAGAYLLYRWYTGGMQLFGGRNMTDKAAFAINVVSGIHLGIAGLSGINIGMRVVGPLGILTPVVIVAGLAYLWSAYHLWKRWKASGETIFIAAPVAPMSPQGGAGADSNTPMPK